MLKQHLCSLRPWTRTSLHGSARSPALSLPTLLHWESKKMAGWDMNTCIPSSWTLMFSQVREKETVAFSCIILLKILWSALHNCRKAWGLLWDQQILRHQGCCLPWAFQVLSKPPAHHMSCFGCVLFSQGWCTNPTGPDGMRRVLRSF